VEGDAVNAVLPWDQVERICWAVARRLWRDGALACEDLVQESLLHIWRKAGTDAGAAMSSGMVGTVAERKIIDCLRQWTHHDRRTKTTPATCVPEDLAFGLHSPDAIDALLTALDAAPIINAMPKTMRRDLLRTVLGYSVAEVSVGRGVSPSAVCLSNIRARKRLKDAA
jgi:DNA-directed RNA polymerase specialized sigma24 family protein